MKEKKLSAREMTFRRQKAIRDMQKQMLTGRVDEDFAKAFDKKSAALERAIQKRATEELAENKVVKGVTQHIDTKSARKLISGKKFVKKIASKIGKKVPGLAGMAIGLGSFLANPSNASASEAIGIGSTGQDAFSRSIEDPTSPEFKARMRMMKKRKKR